MDEFKFLPLPLDIQDDIKDPDDLETSTDPEPVRPDFR